MRLVHLTEHCAARLEMDSAAFRDIDRVRASYLHRLNAEFAAGREPAIAERTEEVAPDPAT